MPNSAARTGASDETRKRKTDPSRSLKKIDNSIHGSTSCFGLYGARENDNSENGRLSED